MKNIVWLASYPKSGNTWCRVFLDFLIKGNTDLNINKLSISIHSDRHLVNEALEIDTTYLFNDEILDLMPEVYEYFSKTSKKRIYLKTHEKYYYLPDGRPNIPYNVTDKALYFVRNPLEIALSYAHHDAIEVSETIYKMNDSKHSLAKGLKSFNQVFQWLGSWSDNVSSWLDEPKFEVLVIKYEDMLLNQVDTFSSIANFLGFNVTKERLENILAQCTFDNLKKAEKLKGFKEKNHNSKSFFRSGKTDTWKKLLTIEQIETIKKDHKKVMERLGYL